MDQEDFYEYATNAWIWLDAQPMLLTLLALMFLDIFSGLCAAIATKTVSSSISYSGMMKKVSTLIVLGVAIAIEPLANGFPISSLAAACFIVTEAMSILENAAKAGVDIPPQVVEVLEKLKPAKTVKGDVTVTTTVHNDKNDVTVNKAP